MLIFNNSDMPPSTGPKSIKSRIGLLDLVGVFISLSAKWAAQSARGAPWLAAFPDQPRTSCFRVVLPRLLEPISFRLLNLLPVFIRNRQIILRKAFEIHFTMPQRYELMFRCRTNGHAMFQMNESRGSGRKAPLRSI